MQVLFMDTCGTGKTSWKAQVPYQLWTERTPAFQGNGVPDGDDGRRVEAGHKPRKTYRGVA